MSLMAHHNGGAKEEMYTECLLSQYIIRLESHGYTQFTIENRVQKVGEEVSL